MKEDLSDFEIHVEAVDDNARERRDDDLVCGPLSSPMLIRVLTVTLLLLGGTTRGENCDGAAVPGGVGAGVS